MIRIPLLLGFIQNFFLKCVKAKLFLSPDFNNNINYYELFSYYFVIHRTSYSTGPRRIYRILSYTLAVTQTWSIWVIVKLSKIVSINTKYLLPCLFWF